MASRSAILRSAVRLIASSTAIVDRPGLGHWVSQCFCWWARVGLTPHAWVALHVRDRVSGKWRQDAVVLPSVAARTVCRLDVRHDFRLGSQRRGGRWGCGDFSRPDTTGATRSCAPGEASADIERVRARRLERPKAFPAVGRSAARRLPISLRSPRTIRCIASSCLTLGEGECRIRSAVRP